MQIKASNGNDLDAVILVDASGVPYSPGASSTSNVLPQGTNRSGTIAASNTAQVLAPANTSRTSLIGQNISSGDLWINEIGGTAAVDAAGSYKITAGNAFSVGTSRAISIIGAAGVVGQKFTATETP